MKKIIKILLILLILFGICSIYYLFHKTMVQNNYTIIGDVSGDSADTLE